MAKQQPDKDDTPISRWLSEPQREEPWNAISGVGAPSFSASSSKNTLKEKNDKKQDSVRATSGSTTGA